MAGLYVTASTMVLAEEQSDENFKHFVAVDAGSYPDEYKMAADTWSQLDEPNRILVTAQPTVPAPWEVPIETPVEEEEQPSE